MTVATRVLRCPQCGASLKWSGSARVVQCAYCQTHVVVETGERTEEAAAVVARKGRPLLGLMAALTVIAVLTMVGLLVGRARSSSAPEATPAAPGVPLSKVAAVSLATTREQLAAEIGVAASGHRVAVPVSGNGIAGVTFDWDAEHPDHVGSVTVIWASGAVPADVVARARAQLGRVPFSYDHWHLRVGSDLSIGAHRFDDPRWKAGVDALWTVVKGAAFGTSDRLDETTRRDVLNLGYPVARLKDVRFDVDVDGAAAEVHRVFPGASSNAARHDVGLDHAWVDKAVLTWENQPGGRLIQSNLYFPETFDFAAHREAIGRCLAPALGDFRKTETDHAAGQWELDFPPHTGVPRLYVSHQVFLILIDPKTDTKDGYAKVIDAIAGCGALPGSPPIQPR